MPRAGRSGGGLFGGFSDPFGDSSPPPVYTGGSGGGGKSESGLTPGTFGADVTSPGAFTSSMQQNTNEAHDFIAGLGAALWGKDNGSLFGGIPGVGDLGRLVGGNPISQVLYKVPGGAADVVGGGLERVTLGQQDLGPLYDALPDDLRAEYDQRIATNPNIANHIRYEALKAGALREQYTHPVLHPTINIPRGWLADSVSWLLGDILGGLQAHVEREISGAQKPTGMNRLQEIEAIAQGGRPTGVLGTGFLAGDRKLSDAESIA
jgi:hypothetical protein